MKGALVPIKGQEEKGAVAAIRGDLLSPYRLAVLAAQRARQLVEGDRPTIQTQHVKPTTIAIEEILKGDFTIIEGKAALAYQEAAARLLRERRNRFLSPERGEELQPDLSKI